MFSKLNPFCCEEICNEPSTELIHESRVQNYNITGNGREYEAYKPLNTKTVLKQNISSKNINENNNWHKIKYHDQKVTTTSKTPKYFKDTKIQKPFTPINELLSIYDDLYGRPVAGYQYIKRN